MDYFEIGKSDFSNMTREERFAAWAAAIGKGTMNVTITAKDAEGNPIVRNMRGDEFVLYLTAWPYL